MYAVWKYVIPIADDFALSLPVGSRLLTVQVQDGIPCLWVEVDTEAPVHSRGFRLAGTGREPGRTKRNPLPYIGSFQLCEGALVFHLFAK